MTIFVLLLSVSTLINLDFAYQSPIQNSKGPNAMQIIAQQYGADDPHGEDPHGLDPHDEYNDDKLPANEAKDKYTAPTNVYGSDVTNTKAPY
jgi:hypothetical protein